MNRAAERWRWEIDEEGIWDPINPASEVQFTEICEMKRETSRRPVSRIASDLVLGTSLECLKQWCNSGGSCSKLHCVWIVNGKRYSWRI